MKTLTWLQSSEQWRITDDLLVGLLQTVSSCWNLTVSINHLYASTSADYAEAKIADRIVANIHHLDDLTADLHQNEMSNFGLVCFPVVYN